jgi:branched-chain amino acid transport system ATP-binding protein
MTNTLLEVQDLGVHFGALKAVDGVSFTIDKGELIGFIGPNGAGKTTTINLLTGVYRKSGGTVRFKDEDITSTTPNRTAKMGIARTFQITKPLMGMSVEENVMTGALFGKGGRGFTVKRAREKARECLEMTGMTGKMDMPVSGLTVPDRKRLELARSLATDPELLLLDEVMAGLRPMEIDESLELITRINSEYGITILFIEHVMRAVMSISQRIIVLNYGKKIAEGNPDEISTNPEVIKAYLGRKYAERSGGNGE